MLGHMAGSLQSASRARPVRERILETSYELFSRRGIRAVGVDELIERAGVAKASLYRHFPSKDDLVVAFLERREHLRRVRRVVPPR
jgi:AcrR family transcriptional regulator